MKWKRITCIVEGQGEVEAVPHLCDRILYSYLHIQGWSVDRDPIRQPRTKLVAAKAANPQRICHAEGLRRALALARAREADAVLVLCDADDDCPAAWGPDAEQVITAANLRGGAVMASREYETWLLQGQADQDLRKAGIRRSDLMRRDAKKLLGMIIPGYKPTTHQQEVTNSLDIGRARAHSDSFDKLVRALAGLCGKEAPERSPVTKPLPRKRTRR